MLTLGSKHAAGYDLRFTGPTTTLYRGETKVLKTGIHLDVPGYWAKIEGRSSLAAKGVFPVGGVIDEDYRGEVTVILHNASFDVFTVNPGDRIAQLVFHPTRHPIKAETLKTGERGTDGFGSTGV